MLDELAQHIIRELQDDARQSFREIGRKLKVSEGTVRNRVKSLTSSKSMRISAIPNPQQLGLNFMCIMCIEVKVGTAELVEENLIKSPNVYYLAGCTGTSSTSGRDEITIPPGCWETCRGSPEISPVSSWKARQRRDASFRSESGSAATSSATRFAFQPSVRRARRSSSA